MAGLTFDDLPTVGQSGAGGLSFDDLPDAKPAGQPQQATGLTFDDLPNASEGGGFVDNATDPQQYAEGVKGIVPGAVRMVGTTLKGVSAYNPERVVASGAEPYMADLERVPKMSEEELVSFYERVDKETPAVSSLLQGAISELRSGRTTFADVRKMFPGPTPVESGAGYRAGKAVTDYADTVLPAAPGYEQSGGRMVGEGLGSLATGLLAAIANPAVGAAAFTASGSGEAVERAIAFDKEDRAKGGAGLTQDQIIGAGIAGVGPGATDVAPVELMLGRLKVPAPLRKVMASKIARIGGQAFIEGLQEGGQQFLQNLIEGTYNPDQQLGEGVLPSAGVGSGVGAIAQTAKELLTSMAGRRGAGRSQFEQALNLDSPTGAAPAAAGGLPTPEGIIPAQDIPPPPPAPVSTPEPQSGYETLYGEVQQPDTGMPGTTEITVNGRKLTPDEVREYLRKSQANVQAEDAVTTPPSAVSTVLEELGQREPGKKSPLGKGLSEITAEQKGGQAAVDRVAGTVPSIPVGEPVKITTPDSSAEIDARPVLVELETLKPASGKLQPRDRSRVEMVQEAKERAVRLDPARLMPDRVSDAGAPIVTADGTVISGNGRVLSIAEVYNNPALKAQADQYKAALPAEAQGMKKPVLVMQSQLQGLDAERFAQQSNRPRSTEMSEPEQARVDSSVMGDILDLYQGGDPESAVNAPFLKAFATNVVSASERNDFSKDGRLSAKGLRRIQGAVLGRAYGDTELLSRMLESTDDNVRAIVGALQDAAPQMAALRKAVQAGQVMEGLDPLPDISAAVSLISDMRKKRLSPARFFRQMDAFTEVNPDVAGWVLSLYNPADPKTGAEAGEHALSRPQMAAIFRAFANEAMQHKTGGFFDDETTRSAILSAVGRNAAGAVLAETPGNGPSDGSGGAAAGQAPTGGRGPQASLSDAQAPASTGTEQGEVEPRARREAFKRLKSGADYEVPLDTISTIYEAVADDIGMVPADTHFGVVERIEKSSDPKAKVGEEVVLVYMRMSNGQLRTHKYLRNFILQAGAFYDPQVNALVFVRLGQVPRLGREGAAFTKSLRGELRHELLHLLRRKEVLSGTQWENLVRHARRLQVLRYAQASFTQLTGKPLSATPEQRTLETLYTLLYRSNDISDKEIQENLDQEAVTHALELAYHGKLNEKEAAPLQGLIDKMELRMYGRGAQPVKGQPMPVGRPVASLAGARALTANANTLKAAKGLLEKGRDAATVYRATGWFQGTDGKWRFEIDDSQARLLQPKKNIPLVKKPTFWQRLLGKSQQAAPEARANPTIKLPDLLEHSQIYEAYPFLKQMNASVVIDANLSAPSGRIAYLRSDGRLIFRGISVAAPNEKEALSGLLHELQHYIQAKEGFAEGASFSKEMDSTKPGKIKRVYSADTQSSKLEPTDFFFGHRHDLSTLPAAERVANEIAEIYEQIDNLGSTAETTEELKAKARKLVKGLKMQLEVSYADYVAAQGEAEARLVQDRMGLTAEQRKATLPFDPEKHAAPPMKIGAFADAADEVVRRAQITREMEKRWKTPQQITDGLWVSRPKENVLVYSATEGTDDILFRAELYGMTGGATVHVRNLDRVEAMPEAERRRLIDEIMADVRARNYGPAVETASMSNKEFGIWHAYDPRLTLFDLRSYREELLAAAKEQYGPNASIEFLDGNESVQALVPDERGYDVERRLDREMLVHVPSVWGEYNEGRPKGIDQDVWDEIVRDRAQRRQGGPLASLSPSSAPALDPDAAGPLRKARDSALEFLQDAQLRVRRLVERSDEPLPDDADPYMAMTLYHGRLGGRAEAATEKAKVILQGANAIAKATNSPLENVKRLIDLYLVAKHAPERNAVHGDGSAGLTNAEATAALARVSALPQGPEIIRVAGLVQEMNRQTLQTLLDGKVISQETFDLLSTTYANHVPLNRILPEGDEELGGILAGGGFDVRGTGLQRARGSKLPIAPILENVLLNHEQAIVRAEKNTVDLATLAFVRRFEEDLKGQITILNGKKAERDIGPAERGIRDQINALKKMLPKDDRPHHMDRMPSKAINDPRVLELREDGERVLIRFRDPKLAAAFKATNSEKMPRLLYPAMVYTRVMSQLATRFNPEFTVPNKVRDIQETAIYIAAQKELGAKGAAKFLLREARGENYKAIIDWMMGRDTPGARLYQEMIDEGGTTGGLALSSRDRVKESIAEIEKLVTAGPANIRKLLKSTATAFDHLNKVFEDSTRLSAYRSAKARGLTKKRAAVHAKEASINFNRMGTAGPVINGLWMFSNASIQGTTKMIRAMKNPKVAGVVVLSMAAAVAALGEWNDQWDEKWREKVTKWDRLNSLIVVLPSTTADQFNYVVIPVSWGLKPILNLTNYAYDAEQGIEWEWGDFLRDMTTATLEAANPVGGTTLTQALVPTALDLPVDIASNTSWSGSKIKPDPQRGVPEDVRYFSSLKDKTSGQASIAATEALVDSTGIAVSPADVNYAFEQTVGGVGRSAGRVLTTAQAVIEGKVPDKDQFPFLARFYRRREGEEIGAGQSLGTETREVRRIVDQQGRERVRRKYQIEGVFEEIKKLPKDEVKKRIAAEVKKDPAVFDIFKGLIESEAKGLTGLDKQINLLGVENGERARYYFDRLQEASPDERRSIVEDGVKKGLISRGVIEQIGVLNSLERLSPEQRKAVRDRASANGLRLPPE